MITLNNKKICENCFTETTVEPCPHCGFVKASYRHDPITLAVGSVLNQRYMIGGVIGKGGFGITYLAYDLKLDARLAVKEYYPMGLAIRNPGSTLVTVSNEESEESFRTGAEKFYNEAKMVARFNGNPNIVSVHDFFYENDTVYFTMGYLQGQTLKSYLKKQKVTEGQAISIFQAISSALMASHSLNILHRDISPDNIMLCDDGSIRLLDFGAARQVMAEQSQSLSVILKQGFAPLEQYQKKGKQGPWTDIYALGATIYTALTGDMLSDPMTRLEDDSEFASNKYGISEKLWNIVQKCTKLKITDRYQDIFELKKDLNSIGIESEAFTDVKEEIRDVLRQTAKPFGSTFGTGSPNPNYAPASDPDATMLLGGGGSQGRTMSMDENATVLLSGQQGGSASNETVAMTPEEAAAYTGARDAAVMQGGSTGTTGQGLQSQNTGVLNGQPQGTWNNTVNMPSQPVTGGYTSQPVTGGYTGGPAAGGYTGQPQSAGSIPYAAPAGGQGMQQPGMAQQIPGNQGGMPYASPASGQQPGKGQPPNMTAGYQQRFNNERQAANAANTANVKKKGIPAAFVVVIAVLGFLIIGGIGITVISRIIIGTYSDTATEASSEASSLTAEDTSESSSGSEETGGSASAGSGQSDALEALGVNDLEKYSDDNHKYSIYYPAGCKVMSAGDDTKEIANSKGTLHVAVRYMDRYIDDTILYNAQDYSDLVNVRRDNLLPVEGAGSTPETDNAGREEIAGQKNIPHFEYHYTDNNDNKWGGNMYIFDSSGQYGCYVVYTLVKGSADDYDELQDYAEAIADSFRIDASYEPEEVKIFEIDDLGVKTSLKNGLEYYTEDDDVIHLKYKSEGAGKDRWIFLLPGEAYGTEYSNMFLGVCGAFSDYDVSITSDMIPLDFGHYSGYWVKADMVSKSEGEHSDALIYAFSTNFGSDAKYQSFMVVGSASDKDEVREVVGGFRFDGATAYDNTKADTSKTIAIESGGTSGDEDVDDFIEKYDVSTSEYIFPGTDSREVTERDVDIFLDSYLDANNAKRLSASEKKTLCARALCYARNEIYARHGYIFQSGELRDLFENMSWYSGNVPGDRFNSNVFNQAEKRNIEFLKSKMDEYGGYQPAK